MRVIQGIAMLLVLFLLQCNEEEFDEVVPPSANEVQIQFEFLNQGSVFLYDIDPAGKIADSYFGKIEIKNACKENTAKFCNAINVNINSIRRIAIEYFMNGFSNGQLGGARYWYLTLTKQLGSQTIKFYFSANTTPDEVYGAYCSGPNFNSLLSSCGGNTNSEVPVENN